jgi:hypothetical protein
MKIVNFSSILSCIVKCIRFYPTMINKKIIIGLFSLNLLNACASPVALLGPTFTFTSTGSTLQTGLSYGSGEIIKQKTGKTPIENLKKITSKEKEEDNIKKKTMESEEFYHLVNSKIKETSNILNLSSQ